jgi:hypothetical protein
MGKKINISLNDSIWNTSQNVQIWAIWRSMTQFQQYCGVKKEHDAE